MKVTMFLYKSVRHDSRVLREATTLGRAGHDVLVVAAHMGPAMDESSDRLRVLTVNKSPRLTWLLWGFIERGQAWTGRTSSRAQRSIVAAGVSLSLGIYGSLAWWRYCLRALLIAARKPADVYIAHDLETLPVAVLAKAMSGGRSLYDAHELYVETPRVQSSRLARRRWAAIERTLIGRADHVMTVSDSIARELTRRYGIARPSILLNVPDEAQPNDTPRDLRAELEVPPASTLVLHLGYLQPYRGLEQVIAAMARCPQAVLVLMGDGDASYVSSLRELVDEMGVGSRAHFLPLVPPDQVVVNARSADLGVTMTQPASLSYRAVLPNKLFQYLAAGLPVLASEFPELTQIVRGHDVGVTCDPSDPQAIAAAIREVTRDPARYAELRRNALACSETFNWATESSKLLRIVESLTRR